MIFAQSIYRTVLKGLGTAIALPWLEAMGPLTSWAAGVETKKPATNRMAMLYVPNGINMADWTPKSEGADFKVPHTLQPLKEFKNINVLTGLTADKARAHGDGGGDHAHRTLASFLTGARPPQDRRRRYSGWHLRRPGGRVADRRPDQARFARRSAASRARWPATAIPAIAAFIRRQCRGAPPHSRCRKK